ncbi:hypothetical protein FDZ84_25055 [Saccharopolyspora sp. ASAGF58]|nr:hypothetical protein FDZ84_25055 [Saccharopolyspora sp. ASAGF58]
MLVDDHVVPARTGRGRQPLLTDSELIADGFGLRAARAVGGSGRDVSGRRSCGVHIGWLGVRGAGPRPVSVFRCYGAQNHSRPGGDLGRGGAWGR